LLICNLFVKLIMKIHEKCKMRNSTI
jgi:hypothetical protein